MKIIGYSKFTSKKGNPLCLVQCVAAPYTDQDHTYGKYGSPCVDIFVPADCHDLIQPTSIGKDLEPQYTMYQGQPRVSSIIVK